MVYAPMFYAETADSLFNKVNTLEDSETENNSASVTYADIELSTITGPTPLVDLAYSFNRDGAGHLRSVSTRITLSGKLINESSSEEDVSVSGISPILNRALSLEGHFAINDGKDLIIKCGVGGTETTYLGCRVVDISVNKTGDNWVKTADYSVTLESKSGAGDCSDADSAGNDSVFYVDNPVDSWSMESIEDFIGDKSPSPQSNSIEWHNPFNSPGGTDLSADPNASSTSPSVTNSPHFRVSHRVSAVGFTTSSNTNAAYLNAKAWVDSRLNLSRDKNDSALATPTTGVSGCSGMPHIFKGTTGLAGMVENSTVLYNHNRQISYSVTDGSYEVSDTWLAMPGGQKSIEEYSIEVSTDERYIKTVRVQGNIKGLYIRDIVGGGSGPSSKGSLVLGPSGAQSSAANPEIGDSKYYNAEQTWISGIKPYLFSRAMSIMGGDDRTVDYVNPTNAALSSTRPNNPIFSKERALNPIPVSTTEGHDHRKGTITYSYEFTNRNIVISGAISSSLSINDTGPTDVISENFVIGRALGPIIQSMGTTTSSRKDVSIDLTVFPPMDEDGFHISNTKCPMYTGGYLWNKTTEIVDNLAPAGAVQYYRSANNYSWSPIDGRFTMNKSWVYQSCTAPTQWPIRTNSTNNSS